MRKILIAMVGIFVIGGAYGAEICHKRCPDYMNPGRCYMECYPDPNMVVNVVPEMEDVMGESVVSGGGVVQSQKVVSSGRGSWMSRHGDTVAVVASGALVVGAAVYFLGMERSDNNPMHVKLATF